VKDLQIAVPPSPEQDAIAGVLADVDALLAKLDQLIAKKRNLKQAVMQQLLTGTSRLPGFDKPWIERTIGEVAEIVSGATPRTSVAEYWGGGIPWCTPTDITATTAKLLTETERTLTPAGLSACSARLLPAGALLLCTRATVGELKIAAMPVSTNQGFKSLVCREGTHNEYLYYQLLTMKSHILAKASGSTFPELSKSETAALVVAMPSLGEQRAIAQVLADMDAELTALEARRDKTRQIKQGMMQALLTGRIRLV
jgi:type I restriction enzyme S subunit